MSKNDVVLFLCFGFNIQTFMFVTKNLIRASISIFVYETKLFTNSMNCSNYWLQHVL